MSTERQWICSVRPSFSPASCPSHSSSSTIQREFSKTTRPMKVSSWSRQKQFGCQLLGKLRMRESTWSTYENRWKTHEIIWKSYENHVNLHCFKGESGGKGRSLELFSEWLWGHMPPHGLAHGAALRAPPPRVRAVRRHRPWILAFKALKSFQYHLFLKPKHHLNHLF